MGRFHTRCKVENIVDRAKSAIIPRLLVDTGNDYTWIPAAALAKIDIDKEKKDVPFVMANGQHSQRRLCNLFESTRSSQLTKLYSPKKAIWRCWGRGRLGG